MLPNFERISNFVYADGVTEKQIEQARSMSKKTLSEAERLSLVKTSKSPTPQNLYPHPKLDRSIYEPIRELENTPLPMQRESHGSGRFTVIQQREWSGEIRIRTRVETSLLQPPLNDGPRVSTKLSERGARKITDSCYYMAKCHGGYKTFITGTFTEDVREQIKAGKTTIQKEVSRTMDSLQKMSQRGWKTPNGTRVEGIDKPLSYCWVVEIPKNADGLPNPHVHILMNWEVLRELFRDWSSRLESIWGNGYFHLEKIHNPHGAGTYIAKAANYFSKGSRNNEQGEVRGNRYGISKNARAPDWITVSESELGVMGKLISDMHQRQQEKNEPLYLRRIQFQGAIRNCAPGQGKNKQVLRERLKLVNEEIRALPIVASPYQILFKSTDEFYCFMGWAMGAGWRPNKRPSSRWLEEYEQRRLRVNYAKAATRLKWTDPEWLAAHAKYELIANMSKAEFPIADYESYLEYCR